MVKLEVPRDQTKSKLFDQKSLRTRFRKIRAHPHHLAKTRGRHSRDPSAWKHAMQSSRQAARLLARRGQAALAVGRSAAASAALKRRSSARIATEARALSSVAKPRSDAAATRAKSSMAMSLPTEEDYAFAPFSQVSRAFPTWCPHAYFVAVQRATILALRVLWPT